jgi:hypothetical protein
MKHPRAVLLIGFTKGEGITRQLKRCIHLYISMQQMFTKAYQL